MSDHSYANVSLEPERYELMAAAPYRFDLDRREFFKFLGAGVLVVSVLKPAIVAQESGGARRGGAIPFPKKSMPGFTSEKTARSRFTPARSRWARTSGPR